ncbi:MAG: NADH-quinone oxidoreductase subunit J [Deltaproteobacteria bacterium]|nr:MAG: NADH-quinone oxidoreductase subunit J [Deltaproteobacteria bacterium]
MSTGGDFLFIVSSMFALGGAVGTVLAKSPLRAAMSLLLTIISLAGIFLTLHAHLLAAIQLIVYAGAVVVLFVFVIMLLGPESTTPAGEFRGLMTRTASAAIAAIVTGGMAFSLVRTSMPYVNIHQCPEGAECGQFGGVVGLGSELYSNSVVPFELISVLLTVAIVGSIAIARGRTQAEAKEVRERRAARAAGDADQAAREAKLTAEVSAHGGH